ncbi:MAG: pyruvate, phosphate dikinase [Candidatus Cloacimonadota bacterium]|nr:pyruvate, phosphate dikinase [Candidatus Cloacimonadota bacterium]
MKIGILGGTFDPIHFGHLKIAEYCKNELGLDQVFFVPSGNPPHKKPVASYKQRKEMLALALEGKNGFKLLELERSDDNSNSYTYHTLIKLQKLYPADDLYFIIGEDNVPEIKNWFKFKKLLQLAQFVVLSRNINDRFQKGPLDYIDKLKFIEIPKIPISSQEIREKLTNGVSIEKLVPEKVLTYIINNSEYSERKRGNMKKQVFYFGKTQVDGDKSLKELLGGKGANLAEMCSIGISVPPGFTLTTEICKYFTEHENNYPLNLREEVENNLKKLENEMGMKLGDPNNPLLLSVRSGAAQSMPGMMDTILNLGLNDSVVEKFGEASNNPRFAWDAYRRLIQMFGNVAHGIDGEYFEEILTQIKRKKDLSVDLQLSTEDLKMIVAQFKEVYKTQLGHEFPQDPKQQLWESIDAVFGSWNNKRAIEYRKINSITGLLGTAVNVQAMVFGNMGNDCATGVAFTRDPSTGKNEFYGEFLVNAQGEDVVAGIRTPQEITQKGSKNWAKNANVPEDERKEKYPSLEELMPEVYKELYTIQKKLENHYKDMQDLEFTIQKGNLFLLQTRTGKRTAHAAVKIAVDMVKEGIIDKEIAIMRIDPAQLDQLLHPSFRDAEKKKAIKEGRLLAKGLPASPGAAVGKVVFTSEDAVKAKEQNVPVILVRKETSPEDISGMHSANGILTQLGGMTSHAAVVARGMGKCCVAGCGDISFTEQKDKSLCFIANGEEIHGGDFISLDGGTGEVIKGKIGTETPTFSNEFNELMDWSDEISKLEVHANADNPKDSTVARRYGAKGIGLCRTEHMFFEEDRIDYVRGMILAETEADRKYPLSELKKVQIEDFKGILEVMQGFPVTIRLLDPPLHEFLPKSDDKKGIEKLSQKFGKSLLDIKSTINKLKEFNPMLGHRGCRLGVTFPDIYKMQVEAIIEASCYLVGKGVDVQPEIMIPLVCDVSEFSFIEEFARKLADEIIKEKGVNLHYKIGTMIEIPRACLVADEIAKEAEFFSFGTNDLTQMGFGFSRDDAGKFLKQYVEKGLLENDPFQSLDQKGIGQLVKIAVEKGRSVNKNLTIGICGEHGGEPKSIEFCHKVGLDYVSCSPFRVPIARLSTAQAEIKNS